MAATYTFEDHSGLSLAKVYDNPYDGLIERCENDPAKIQAVYEKHRTNRNAQQRSKLLSAEFHGVTVDEILSKLETPQDGPGYVDPRNCLVFWARPTATVRDLIAHIQHRLKSTIPNLWVMPSSSLHMTTLEVTHSLTEQEIEGLVSKILPHAQEIANYSLVHRARLVKPIVSYDAQAFALSFAPAAGEPGRPLQDDQYSYHQLRRDMFAKVKETGVVVESRYVVPSAHLTIGRYVNADDLSNGGQVDAGKMQQLVRIIEDINAWLVAEHWPTSVSGGTQWLVGQERGFTFQKGRLWYGGGETVVQGAGFA